MAQQRRLMSIRTNLHLKLVFPQTWDHHTRITQFHRVPSRQTVLDTISRRLVLVSTIIDIERPL